MAVLAKGDSSRTWIYIHCAFTLNFYLHGPDIFGILAGGVTGSVLLKATNPENRTRITSNITVASCVDQLAACAASENVLATPLLLISSRLHVTTSLIYYVIDYSFPVVTPPLFISCACYLNLGFVICVSVQLYAQAVLMCECACVFYCALFNSTDCQ